MRDNGYTHEDLRARGFSETRIRNEQGLPTYMSTDTNQGPLLMKIDENRYFVHLATMKGGITLGEGDVHGSGNFDSMKMNEFVEFLENPENYPRRSKFYQELADQL
jgi:hypothetical protein